ncbi:hypothetical protein PsYK624_062670 [Phanerochaete sordida]|uniref:Uncharacterized protein n=1 Tax=Phanerochaete sordida TaxID=48140 RepID=A0A9P3G6F8_9APHY|nr:hypothetical protein PsYK624_062670 [Phanerochaete sordida]
MRAHVVAAGHWATRRVDGEPLGLASARRAARTTSRRGSRPAHDEQARQQASERRRAYADPRRAREIVAGRHTARCVDDEPRRLASARRAAGRRAAARMSPRPARTMSRHGRTASDARTKTPPSACCPAPRASSSRGSPARDGPRDDAQPCGSRSRERATRRAGDAPPRATSSRARVRPPTSARAACRARVSSPNGASELRGSRTRRNQPSGVASVLHAPSSSRLSVACKAVRFLEPLPGACGR